MLSWLLGAETEAEKELQLCIDKATSALIIAPDQSDIAGELTPLLNPHFQVKASPCQRSSLSPGIIRVVFQFGFV